VNRLEEAWELIQSYVIRQKEEEKEEIKEEESGR
jgi:hypothetical protein